MIYTARYRSRDGRLAEESVEAASRAEAIAALRARGIVPQSVREGGAAASRSAPSGGGFAKGALAGVLVVALAVAGWFFFLREKPQPPAPVEKPKPVAKVKPVKVEPRPVAEVKPEPVKTERPKAKEPRERKKRVLPPPPPASPSNIVIHVGNTNKVKRVFESATESVLHMLASTVPGDMPPPIPNLPKFEDLKKILETTIVVHKGESEAREIAKENVATLKAHLEEHIKNGGNPDDFVKTYRNWLHECAVKRRDYERLVRKTLKTEGKAQAKADLQELNSRLKAEGIKQIEIPQRLWDAAQD